MRIAARTLAVPFTLIVAASIANSQVATGSYPYGTFDNQGPDIVNVANLDVHLGIPVLHKAGRGIPFNYDLTFDNSIWYPVTSNGTTSWTPVQNFGWSGAVESATGYVSYSTYSVTDKQCSSTIDTAFTYHDPFGVQHPFAGLTTQYTAGCGTNTPSLTAKATDGSGYTLYLTNYNSVALSKAKGGQFYPPTQPNGATPAMSSSLLRELRAVRAGPKPSPTKTPAETPRK